jgi:hypothetical protein
MMRALPWTHSLPAAAFHHRSQGWTGWICYNDEPPDASGIRGGVTFGHCKGVLTWSPTKLGWLVHSMPAWPARFSDRELSAFAPSGIRCGQSFVWLDMRRTQELTRRICGRSCVCVGGRGGEKRVCAAQLTRLHTAHTTDTLPSHSPPFSLADQIRLMGACVYAARVTPDEEARVGFAEDRQACRAVPRCAALCCAVLRCGARHSSAQLASLAWVCGQLPGLPPSMSPSLSVCLSHQAGPEAAQAVPPCPALPHPPGPRTLAPGQGQGVGPRLPEGRQVCVVWGAGRGGRRMRRLSASWHSRHAERRALAAASPWPAAAAAGPPCRARNRQGTPSTAAP